jgi:hypothetical protein
MRRRTAYHTTSGPRLGPILWRDRQGSIDVVEGPDDPRPIGMAVQVGQTVGGVSLWKLTVQGDEVPGQWLVVGREFRPAPDDGRAPR